MAFLRRFRDFTLLLKDTRNSTLLCLTQVNWFREHSASFWRLSLSTRFTAYVPFTPSHSEEHLPPPSYRGCWHGVSRGFFLESCHDRALDERALRAGLALLHSRDIAGSGFRPLSKIPHCCPPWESGPCLSPSVADHPKRPAKHHWLGQPLPDQLPNTTQAHQTALFSFLQDLARTVRQIPTRYAPVRHFVLNSSHPLGETSYL